MEKKIEIWADGRVRVLTTAENIELASLYFREHGYSTTKAAQALAKDDGTTPQHTVYEWLAVVHEAKARLDRECEFRGR